MIPGWQNLQVTDPQGTIEVHCVPVLDLYPHQLATGLCACHPKEPGEDYPHLWVHNAFDRREDYMNGRRLH